MVVSRQVHFIILITRDQFKKTFTKLISVVIVLASTNIVIIIHHILGDPGADTGDKRKSKRAQKCGVKKSKEWQEEPLGTMSYQTSSKWLPPFWLLIGARKTQVFWHQSEARTAATVWNWSGKTLSPGALLAVLYFSSFHIYFSTRLDFPSPPLSTPGSPKMHSPLPLSLSSSLFSSSSSSRHHHCYYHHADYLTF